MHCAQHIQNERVTNQGYIKLQIEEDRMNNEEKKQKWKDLEGTARHGGGEKT